MVLVKTYIAISLALLSFCSCSNHDSEHNSETVPKQNSNLPFLLQNPKNHAWLENAFKYQNFPSYAQITNNEFIKGSISDLNDTLFHLYHDSLLKSKIIGLIDFDITPRYIKNKSVMDSILSEFRKKLRQVETPLIEDQIWDAEPHFRINFSNPNSFRIKPDVPSHYLASINQLKDMPYDTCVIRFNELITSFKSIDDDRLKISLLFKLLIQAINQHTYLENIYKLVFEIKQECIASDELSNSEKAKFILGCAKINPLLSPMDDDAIDYPSLKVTQAYCEILRSDADLAYKIDDIIYTSLLQSPEPEIVKLMPSAYTSMLLEFRNKKRNYRDIKNMLLSAQYELRLCRTLYQETGISWENKLLEIASRIQEISHYINDDTEDKLQHEYLILLSDYYRQELKLDVALRCLFRALEIQLNSSDAKLQVSFLQTVRRIELLLKDSDSAPSQLHTWSGYEPARPMFILPRDFRLWKRNHVDSLKEKLKTHHMQFWFMNSHVNKLFYEFTEHTTDNVLQRLALYELRENNLNDARYFLLKRDSVFDPTETYSPENEAMFSQDLVKQSHFKREISNKNMIIIFIVSGLLLIAILFGIAVYQWRKAAVLSQHNQYKSAIWQEFGHISKSAITSALQKLNNDKNGTSAPAIIDALYDLTDSMFKSLASSTKEISTLKDELTLAKNYVSYETIIRRRHVNFIYPNDLPDNIPTVAGVMLSLVKNALHHAEILDKNDGTIEIQIAHQGSKIKVSIMNNGKGFPENINSISDVNNPNQTGLKNSQRLMRLYRSGAHRPMKSTTVVQQEESTLRKQGINKIYKLFKFFKKEPVQLIRNPNPKYCTEVSYIYKYDENKNLHR